MAILWRRLLVFLLPRSKASTIIQSIVVIGVTCCFAWGLYSIRQHPPRRHLNPVFRAFVDCAFSSLSRGVYPITREELVGVSRKSDCNEFARLLRSYPDEIELLTFEDVAADIEGCDPSDVPVAGVRIGFEHFYVLYKNQDIRRVTFDEICTELKSVRPAIDVSKIKRSIK